MAWSRGARRLLQTATTAALTVAVVPPAAASAGWTVTLRSGSHAQAGSQHLPSPPGSVASACVSSSKAEVTVTWEGVAGATYTVYQSTTSATSGYAAVAAGLTTTSWTSGTLSSGDYWYELVATLGSKWASPDSAATAERVIGNRSCA